MINRSLVIYNLNIFQNEINNDIEGKARAIIDTSIIEENALQVSDRLLGKVLRFSLRYGVSRIINCYVIISFEEWRDERAKV